MKYIEFLNKLNQRIFKDHPFLLIKQYHILIGLIFPICALMYFLFSFLVSNSTGSINLLIVFLSLMGFLFALAVRGFDWNVWIYQGLYIRNRGIINKQKIRKLLLGNLVVSLILLFPLILFFIFCIFKYTPFPKKNYNDLLLEKIIRAENYFNNNNDSFYSLLNDSLFNRLDTNIFHSKSQVDIELICKDVQFTDSLEIVEEYFNLLKIKKGKKFIDEIKEVTGRSDLYYIIPKQKLEEFRVSYTQILEILNKKAWKTEDKISFRLLYLIFLFGIIFISSKLFFTKLILEWKYDLSVFGFTIIFFFVITFLLFILMFFRVIPQDVMITLSEPYYSRFKPSIDFFTTMFDILLIISLPVYLLIYFRKFPNIYLETISQIVAPSEAESQFNE